MATAPGIDFKVKGSVDPSFTSSVAAATAGATQAAGSSRTWAQTLGTVASVAKSGALTLAAFVIEQKRHNDLTRQISQAAKEQQVAQQALLEKGMIPLTNQIKQLAAAQQQYQAATKENTATVAANTATSADLTIGMKDLETQVGVNTEKMASFKFAAQQAFYGNYTGAVSELVTSLGYYAGAAGVVTTAVWLTNEALDAYEKHQIAVGKSIEDQSARLAKAATAWHTYGQAVASTEGQIDGAKLVTKTDSKYLADTLARLKGNIAAKSPLEIMQSLSGSEVSNLPGTLDATNKELATSKKVLGILKDARVKSHFGERKQITDKDTANAVGGDSLVAFEATGVFSASKGKIAEALARQEKIYQQLEQTKTILQGTKEKTDEWKKSLDELAGRKDRIAEVNNVFKEFGSRSALVQARDFTATQLSETEAKYKQLTGGGKTDQATLGDAVLNGRGERRDIARLVLARRKDLNESNKALKEFDAAADRTEIEAGQKKIALLQEQLELKKALGNATTTDVADTLSQQLDAVAAKDVKGRTALLSAQRAEHGKFLEEDFKGQTEDLKNAYRELQASGTATAAQLQAANLKVAQAAKQWQTENAGVLQQFPQLKAAAEQLLSGTRAETSRNKQRKFDEGFEALKGGIAKGEDGALTGLDRMAANKAAIEATNRAFDSGLINQKQKTEELATLEKQRAGLQRQIADGLEQQNKALNALKGQFAGERLQRLQSAIAKGDTRAEGEKQGLESEVLKSKLDAIDQEYQAAVKAGRDQVLAAQQAKLEKERLYESEADKFQQEEDRKTAAFREAAKSRVGGSASPLSGLDSLSSGVAGFSGFGAFSDGFQSSVYGKGTIDGLTKSSKFEDYQRAQLPGYLKDQFSRSPSYAGTPPPVQKAGDIYNNHFTAASSPKLDSLLTEAGREAALEARRRKMTSGDGAPDSIRSRY